MCRLNRRRPLCLLLGLALGLCAFGNVAAAANAATLDVDARVEQTVLEPLTASTLDEGGEEAPSRPVITVKTDDTEPTPMPPPPEPVPADLTV